MVAAPAQKQNRLYTDRVTLMATIDAMRAYIQGLRQRNTLLEIRLQNRMEDLERLHQESPLLQQLERQARTIRDYSERTARLSRANVEALAVRAELARAQARHAEDSGIIDSQIILIGRLQQERDDYQAGAARAARALGDLGIPWSAVGGTVTDHLVAEITRLREDRRRDADTVAKYATELEELRASIAAPEPEPVAVHG